MDIEVPSMEHRKDLARHAKRRSTRINSFSSAIPTDWCPWKVLNPKTGFYFSDDSAWELIVVLLEDESCPATFKKLDVPRGVQAVEIIWVLQTDRQPLYIKVHMVKDKIMGRSFHYSTVKQEKM